MSSVYGWVYAWHGAYEARGQLVGAGSYPPRCVSRVKVRFLGWEASALSAELPSKARK